MNSVTVAVLGRDRCPATGGVRTALGDAGVACSYPPLGGHDAYRTGCSFTVPAVVGDLAQLGVGPSSPLA